ncbi:MAG: M20 family metallopeptidase [Candidatus Omnitrophica bacterium]|nr:M20 family metallopeptidase [Candidatus Omnitrophota bacterium]
MVNKSRLLKLTQQLIQINSENPPGNEVRIVNFVRKYLLDLGLRVRVYEFKKNRPNIIGYLEKRVGKGSLLITPHLDTVPAGKHWKVDPFLGRIIKDKIYGLGATDCKGNLACALEAINSLVEDKRILDYNLIFAATADEESGSDFGLIPLLKKKILKPDAALVLDAEEFEIIVNQKGLIHLKLKLEGVRAHGASPELGVNAIDIAMSVIKDIRAYKFPYIKNKYLKPPTINVGSIKGGDKVNVVADWCEVELDFRFLPGTKACEILKVLKNILKKNARKFSLNNKIRLKTGKIEIEGIQEPYSISERHFLVKGLTNSLRVLGIKACLYGSEGATVITFFQDQSIPAIATGFGARGCAHVSNEYIKLSDLYKGAQVLENFLVNHKS